MEHFVTIRLRWFTNASTGERYPYKWGGACRCGWKCLSWSWDRKYDVLESGLTLEQWMEENGGPPVGGALVMALEHITEQQAEIAQAIASIRAIASIPTSIQ